MLGIAGLGVWSGSAGADGPGRGNPPDGGGGTSGRPGGDDGKGNPHVIERIEALESELADTRADLADTRAELEATREAIGTFEFEETDGELELEGFAPSSTFGDGIESDLVDRIEDASSDEENEVAVASEAAEEFTRGASLVDAIGGGVAGRLGEAAFPGDALIESIEKGLIVSIRDEGFPADGIDLDAAFPDPAAFPDSFFIPGDAFVTVLEATLAERMTAAFPDSFFSPDQAFFPDSFFSPEQPYFPDSFFLPGETLVDAIGGGVSGRLGEAAFPGDALMEAVETGLIVSIRDRGFPDEGVDLDDDFGELFIPGDAFVDTVEARLAERMTAAFPDQAFFPDSFFSPDDRYFPDSFFMPGETFVDVVQTRGPLHAEVEGLSDTLGPVVSEVNNLSSTLAGGEIGYTPIVDEIQFEPFVVRPIVGPG